MNKDLIIPVGHKMQYKSVLISDHLRELYTVKLIDHFDELHTVIHQNVDNALLKLPRNFRYVKLIDYPPLTDLLSDERFQFEYYSTFQKNFEL